MRLPAPKAQRIRQKDGSYLADEQGQRLPAITTILNATKPYEDRRALAQWRQRQGEATARQITRTACDRGSGTHRQMRAYLLGKDLPCPPQVAPYWESLTSVLADIQDVQLVESPVFHYPLRYAGIVDCVASYRGVPCICDWKTADRPKGSVQRLYDAPLQLVAYCGAVNAFYNLQSPIQHAMLVVALPDRPAEVFWFDVGAMTKYWCQWQKRLRQFGKLQRNSE